MGSVLRRGKVNSENASPTKIIRGIMNSDRKEWKDFKNALVQYHGALDQFKFLSDDWYRISKDNAIEIIASPSMRSLADANEKVHESRLSCARAIVSLRNALYSEDPQDEELYRQAATHDTALLDELKRVEARYFGGPLIGNLPIFISDTELNELLDIYTTFSLARQRKERSRDKQRA